MPGFDQVLWLLLAGQLQGRPRGWRAAALWGAPACCPGPAPDALLSPTPQNMEKVVVPSVTLIVGCGVSSLTLLMLIIIYVSVWRWRPCPVAGGGQGGLPGGQGGPGSGNRGHISFLQSQVPQCLHHTGSRLPPALGMLPLAGALDPWGSSVPRPRCLSCHLAVHDHGLPRVRGSQGGDPLSIPFPQPWSHV